MSGGYSFRIKIKRSPRNSIDETGSERTFTDPVTGTSIRWVSSDPSIPIKNSDYWYLKADGWRTAEEAEEVGRRFIDALKLSLVRVRIGADFGRQTPKSVLTEHGLKWAAERFGRERALNDEFGLIVFESSPPPAFAKLNVGHVHGITDSGFRWTRTP